ncbi:TerC family protein [Chitinophaga sp. S165]|uniref:TerC family protein n=1 Tax=Chitinophaga sp. S165 TaxID=2135462 RepID=UPI000D7119A0|nr:TerC family protein [Chitinophaga sp. S165]PWV53451.1 YkoY family integral membrane protein [Chitinophaga sp. S165]
MQIAEMFQQIMDNPIPALLIVGNLIIIESLLSVDNAAVLATMVMDLPKEQRNRALKYGIIGAYVFRGICLLFASLLIKVWWLKPVGGLYLLYLTFDYFRKRAAKAKGEKEGILEHETEEIDKSKNWLYKATIGWMGQFWATVALVELMDLAFSIDNVFAAVAFSDNIVLIWTGVFIGILAMRFVAQGFVRLMERYPFLEIAAFLVIGVLGIKLMLAVYEHFYPETAATKFLESHQADWATSLITVAIFVVPIITSLLFNFPKKHKVEAKAD